MACAQPQTAERTNVNTPPASQSVHTYSAQRRRRTSTALPARALFIYPGRFSSPQTAPAPWPYNYRNRECPGADAGCTLRCAQSPYYSTLYGIKSALPGRQHERGIPLSNSPLRRGPAPHTPRQRFAAAPRPAPGAGLAETPHAVSPASFRVTPAGASTARSSHAPAPPYHPAVRTRRHVTHRTTDPQLHARQDAGRSPSPPLGGAAPRPSPSLRSTSPVACAAQAHSLPAAAVCANVSTCRRRRASRYSAQQRRRWSTVSTTRAGPLFRHRSDRSRCFRDAFPLPPMPQFRPAPPV